jgi:hypothetical protein
MTTIIPPIGVRISGIQSLETAKVAIKNGAGIAFIFNHARKRGSTKLKHLENRHPIIIHLNCQEKRPFILGHL